MNYIDETSLIELSSDQQISYTSMTYDGAFYYMTVAKNPHIHKFDQTFQYVASYPTNEVFQAICYDENQLCFWACDGITPIIFQLNDRLKVIDHVSIQGLSLQNDKIFGISICDVYDTLYVCLTHKVIEVETTGNIIGILEEAKEEIFCTVTCFSTGYLILSKFDEHQQITIYSYQNKRIETFPLSMYACIHDVLLYPNTNWLNGEIQLYLLSRAGEGTMFLTPCCLPLLPLKEEPCEETTCCCDTPCFDCIIESIALIEASLSHILNAEGEKLQKAIVLADNICDLLEVNTSVTNTIIRVTQLETILYEKLSLVVKSDNCYSCKQKEESSNHS